MDQAEPTDKHPDAATGRVNFAFAGGVQLTERAARQNIASYAHRHGVVVTRRGQPVGEIAAVRLCRILRAAVENSSGPRRERVETLVRAIALSLRGQGGPLCVPKTALNALRRLGRARRMPGDDGASRADA
jgi:hypothetical protein